MAPGYKMSSLAFARARPQLYRLMFDPALAGKPGHADLRAAGQSTYAGLSQAVGAVLAPQGGTAEDASAHAVATWALVHGLAMLLLDGRLSAPPRQRRGNRAGRAGVARPWPQLPATRSASIMQVLMTRAAPHLTACLDHLAGRLDVPVAGAEIITVDRAPNCA